MCGNDGFAGYVIKALSEQQMADKVAVTGQDADIEACQRIVEGTQSMTVYKPIEELASTTAECAVELAKGEALDEKIREGMGEKETETGKKVPYYKLMPVAVTADNIDEVIINSGFHLHDEVYLNVGETEIY
jgi:D-xylose transport system substrate-binding protein